MKPKLPTDEWRYSTASALLVLPAPNADGKIDAAEVANHLVTQSRVDLHLAERVERSLRATGYPSLRALEISVCGRLVILRGRVPSYYMKQLAQAVAMTVPGIDRVDNDLEVL
jgi:osmotically-inducible protein OsmY